MTGRWWRHLCLAAVGTKGTCPPGEPARAWCRGLRAGMGLHHFLCQPQPYRLHMLRLDHSRPGSGLAGLVRCTKARSACLLNSACPTTSRNWPGVIRSRIRRYVRQPQGGCLEYATAFQVQLFPVQEMPCDVSAVRLHRPRPLHLLVPKPATVTPRTQGPAVTCDNGLRVRGAVR